MFCGAGVNIRHVQKVARREIRRKLIETSDCSKILHYIKTLKTSNVYKCN